jgi:tetratricopeptide (TPR) repeat protein
LGISAGLLALPILAFLPFLQILPAGEVFAPRFTHLPLLLGIPLAERLLSRLGRFWLIPIGVALLIGANLASYHYSSASSYWQAALTGAPKSPAVWNALGVAHADEGRHAEAIVALERALGYNERYSKAWSNLALSQMELGEDERAALRNAVRYGPKNAIAHINLGKSHMRSHADDEAHSRFASAAQNAAAAKRLFLRATELNPGRSSAWRNLALSHRALGEEDQAARAAARARTPTRE